MVFKCSKILLEFIFLLILSNAVIADNDKPVTYTFGVVPQFTGLAVHRDWTPILNQLHEKTPYRFRLKLYASIMDFEKAFLEGEPDIAFMNPYHAVMAKRAHDYRPLIRDGARKLTGILVVRKDSPFQSVNDLEGSEIAFPSPNAFAASLYMRALLHEELSINFKTKYTKTHSNAYRHVLLGKSAACGAVYRTLNIERKEVLNHLRVLYKTPSTASHPLVAHKRVPVAVSEAIQKVMLSLADEAYGKKLLKAVLLPKPVIADYDRDYAFLEKLKLEKYVVVPN